MAGIYDVRRQMRRLTQPSYTTAATSTRARSPYDLLKDLQKFVQPYAREQGGMTQTQRETLPYLEKIKAQKERSRGLLQPVEAILDILNRGQYVTANIAQQITDNVNQGQEWWVGIPEAVKQGLTGERKGDWEKVLFGGELSGKEIKGWVPWRPETKAGKFAKGVAGFAANVLLDPTTYIGFGPATGARSAATKYADDVVRISMREIGQNAPEMLPKLIQSGYDSTKFTELLAKNAPEGFAYLTKYAGQDISKYMSRVWNRSYRDALRKPAEELTQGMTKRINDVLEKMTGKEVSTKLTGAADLGLKQLPGKVAPISESERLVEMLQKLEGKPYAGAGTRAGRFMRKEFAVGERNPTWLQAMDQMRDRFTQSKIGGMFSDAWWSVMNSQRSPIGKLKRLLHIRNPYQKMLSIMERDISYDTANSAMLKGERLRKIFEPMSQDQRDEVLGSMLMSQVMQEKARRTGQTAVDATVVARRLADEKNSEVVVDAINKINAVTKEWDSYNDWAFRIGVAPETGTWHDYLPIQQTTSEAWKKSGTQLGSAHPGWTRAREMGWGEHLEQELETIKWMLGVDSKTAARALKEGVGDINVNLENMLMRRAFAQARFEQHVDMVLKFREFGIDVKSLQKTDPKVYERLTSKWGRLEPLGLKSMEGVPGLEGYLFDSDVSDIFDRAIKATSSDRNLNALANTMRGFTSWWRGWATLSPGFHLRNFFSNNVTGFLKHGVEWLDPRVHGEAFMAAVVGLHGYDEGVKRLTKIFPEDLVKKTLARRVSGGASLAELAEYGGRTGIATRMSMGFGEPKTYEDVVRMEGKLLQNVNVNPFSGDFSGFKVSREAGAYIESTSKMQSFILDYRRAMKQGGNAQAAAEWAKNEARKWWIDYCFDEKTEILTDRGWKKWDTIQPTDNALSFSMSQRQLEWQPIRNIYVNDYDGPMYSISNKHMDALVTPKHKWIKNGGVQGGHWSIRTTGTIHLRETREIIDKRCTLVLSSDRYDNQTKIYSDEFVKLVGWVLTEGTYPKPRKRRDRPKGKGIVVSNRIYFYQSITHNPQYVEEIRDLVRYFRGEGISVNEVNYTMSNGVKIFYIGKPIAKEIRGLFPDKILTMDFVLKLSQDQCRLLMETILKGDGTRKQYNSGGEHWELTQKNKEFCDVFQTLCFLAGYRTVIRWDIGKECYSVSILRKGDKFYLHEAKRENIPYKGKIWCITTDNHTLVARRNDRIYLSGNSDLTPFEEGLREVIPFYVWTRNNLSNQITGMMQFKEMYSLLPKATEAAGIDMDRRELPDWMRELGMIPIAETQQGLYKMFWPNFPYQDLNKIPVKFRMVEGLPVPSLQDPWETVSDIAQDAHPVIKNAIEVIGNVDIFYREPMGDVRKAPRLMRALTKAPGALLFLDGLMRGLGFQNGLRVDVNAKGQLMIDSRMGKILEDNILILNRLPQFWDAPELLFPALETIKQRVTGAVDDYEGTEEIMQTISFYLGVKTKMADVEEERFRRNQELIEEAQAARRKEQRYTPQHTTRSLKWRQQQTKMQRKLGL